MNHLVQETIFILCVQLLQIGREATDELRKSEAFSFQLSAALDNHGQTRKPAAVGIDLAAPEPEDTRRKFHSGRGRAGIPLGRSLPVGRYVVESGGSSAEKRPEALGDGKEQRLLPPAEEERPWGADGQVHR